MNIERWIVEKVLDSTTGETEELRGFASPGAARDFATKYSIKHRVSTSITWLLEEISRDGRTVLDAEITEGFNYPEVAEAAADLKE